MIDITATKQIIRLLIFICIGFFLGILITEYLTNNHYSKFEKVGFDIGVNEVIYKIRASRSDALIESKGGRKLWIYHVSYNHGYKPSSLNHFLRQGDSIVKKPHSNRLVIFRGTDTYLFYLGSDIGR